MLYRVPRPPFGGPPFFQPGGPYRPPLGPPMGERPEREPGGQDGPPGRPPSFTPEMGPTLRAVDPGAIRRCRYKFTYLWLKNRQEFWAYLTFVGRRSVSGYRWTGFRWVYFGTDLRNIESFVCY
ncbi:hypothetical protein [Wukongibacter sp. M2B1]|uniref:hypothetical protein n=1 Tax=Wukongibacter sp. M2B1 TaxID=3088895 RepID=UPI003D794296